MKADPAVAESHWYRIDAWPLTQRIRRIVDANPGKVAASFFFGGFIWDYLTLTRVDAVFDNLLLLLYVAMVSVVGYYAMLGRAGAALPGWVQRGQRWLPLAMQFAFGALFSANVVFYWQSTTLSAGAFYFIILVALLVANEFVAHDRSPIMWFGLLFIASHSFFMFLVPVVLARIGFAPFLLAGLLSLCLCGTIWLLLTKNNGLPGTKNRVGSVGLVVGLFALSNFLYLERLIPPVPLAVREVGVFHSVERDQAAFALTFEPAGEFFRRGVPSATYHRAPNERIYCFASVFAPTRFEDKIFHSWYRYNETSREWEQRDRIGYTVEGGRSNGFRGYTYKSHVEPGEWRVDVETRSELVIGRLFFDVVDVAEPVNDLRLRFK